MPGNFVGQNHNVSQNMSYSAPPLQRTICSVFSSGSCMCCLVLGSWDFRGAFQIQTNFWNVCLNLSNTLMAIRNYLRLFLFGFLLRPSEMFSLLFFAFSATHIHWRM